MPPTVQGVLGPLAPDRLGRVDAHEHLFLTTPALPGEEYDDLDRIAEEVARVGASGIGTVVDLTPVGLGRDPRGLAEVARRTGVQVVAATGFHRDAHYPAGHWALREPAEALLAVLLQDLTAGMDGRDWQGPVPSPTEVRAGIVKLGASYQRLSPAERRRLEVGAEAARRTGVPVAVHCEVGTLANELLDLLERGGVPPERVVLAHMDRNPDADLHRELADRGAYLLYDQVGRVMHRPESQLVGLVAELVDSGHHARVLLGTDTARRSALRAYGGGPGMDVLGRAFLPRLERRVGGEAVDRIVRANPARVLPAR
jgi:predicted metal-dependent phosphotriesterase family hydrolase